MKTTGESLSTVFCLWCVFMWLSCVIMCGVFFCDSHFPEPWSVTWKKKLKTCKSDSRRCTRGWICVWNEQSTNNKKKTNDSGGESNLLQIRPRHLLHFPHPFWAIKGVVIAKKILMIYDWLLWLLTIDDISNDGLAGGFNPFEKY